MRLKTIDPVSLIGIVKTISNFLEEANFLATPEGLRLAGMDPARVSYVVMNLPKTYFEEYESKEKEEITFKTEELYKILSRAQREDTVILEVNEGEAYFRFEGFAERTFRIQSLSSPYSENNLNLNFGARLKIQSNVFVDVVSELEEIGDILNITVRDQGVVFKSKGDLATEEVEVTSDYGLLEIEVKQGEVTSLHSLEYFKKLVDMKSASDIVELSVGRGIPCKVRFELPQGGIYDTYIAPRMDED